MSFNFKQRLDRYLTTEPTNDYGTYFELVYENYSEEFYENIGEFEASLLEDHWIRKCYDRERDPKRAAELIERTIKIFKPKL